MRWGRWVTAGQPTGQRHLCRAANGAGLFPGAANGAARGGHSLVPLAGATAGLVAVGPVPARLTVADGALGAGGLADAVQAVELAAGLAARHHPRRHPRLGEVLQLVVDVEVADAAVEAGAVEELPEAEGGRVDVHGHPWGERGCQHARVPPTTSPAPALPPT